MPVFTYFSTVGSLLIGLLYYANSVMEPVPQSFPISQITGLPKPFKAPRSTTITTRHEHILAISKPPQVEAGATKPDLSTKTKNRKVASKHKPVQAAGGTRQRYADYPQRELGSIW